MNGHIITINAVNQSGGSCTVLSNMSKEKEGNKPINLDKILQTTASSYKPLLPCRVSTNNNSREKTTIIQMDHSGATKSKIPHNSIPLSLPKFKTIIKHCTDIPTGSNILKLKEVSKVQNYAKCEIHFRDGETNDLRQKRQKVTETNFGRNGNMFTEVTIVKNVVSDGNNKTSSLQKTRLASDYPKRPQYKTRRNCSHSRQTDTVELGKMLGITAKDMTAAKLLQRKNNISTKLKQSDDVSFTKFEEYDIHSRAEKYACTVEPNLDYVLAEQGQQHLQEWQKKYPARKKRRRHLSLKENKIYITSIDDKGPEYETFVALDNGLTLLRPPTKLVELVAEAINGSPDGLLQVHHVYNIIMARYPYFQYMKPEYLTSWRSSVRHALYQKWFRKLTLGTNLINAKGCYWGLSRKINPVDFNLPCTRKEQFEENNNEQAALLQQVADLTSALNNDTCTEIAADQNRQLVQQKPVLEAPRKKGECTPMATEKELPSEAIIPCRPLMLWDENFTDEPVSGELKCNRKQTYRKALHQLQSDVVKMNPMYCSGALGAASIREETTDQNKAFDMSLQDLSAEDADSWDRYVLGCGKPDFSYSSPDINSSKPSDQVQSFTPELIRIKPNNYPVQQPGHYHSSENYQYHDEHYSTTTSLTEESSAHQQQQHKFYSQYGIDSEQSICAGVFSSPIETLGSSIVGSRCHSVVDSCSPVKNLRCDFPFSPLDNVL